MQFRPVNAVKNLYLDQTQVITERQLQRHDLGEAQIGKQKLEQLELSLRKINNYIEKPESLLPMAANNPLIRPRIIHLLETRRKLLIDYVENFRAEQTIGKIRDLIYRVRDESLKEKLNSELDEFEKRCEDLKKQLHENQSRVWQMILTRDAIVTIIFGIIGLIIVSAFVIGMFSERQIPDVFSDFLLTTFGYLGASLSMKSSRDVTQRNHSENNFQVPPLNGGG